VTFQTHATETRSPSRSLVVVEAWRLVFVVDVVGLKVGVVALGGLLIAVAVLLAGVLSFGDETVALLVSVAVPLPGGGVTTMVMFGAAPGARLPPVRLHVTVPEELMQFQFVPVALTNDVPAGRLSTTVTPEASFGPAFDTPMV
jgi:hypothetical protein